MAESIVVNPEVLRLDTIGRRRGTKHDSVYNPEFAEDGCDIAELCLECPLPFCRFDVTLVKQINYIQEWQILEARYKRGLTRRETHNKLPDVPISLIKNTFKKRRRTLARIYKGKEHLLPVLRRALSLSRRPRDKPNGIRRLR